MLRVYSILRTYVLRVYSILRAYALRVYSILRAYALRIKKGTSRFPFFVLFFKGVL